MLQEFAELYLSKQQLSKSGGDNNLKFIALDLNTNLHIMFYGLAGLFVLISILLETERRANNVYFLTPSNFDT